MVSDTRLSRLRAEGIQVAEIADFTALSDIGNVFATIKNGVPAKGMIGWQLVFTPRQIQEVASYVLSLRGHPSPGSQEAGGGKMVGAGPRPGRGGQVGGRVMGGRRGIGPGGDEQALNAREGYRDAISIVSREGKRRWIYPKEPAGRYHAARVMLSAFLVAVLFGTPFVTVHGQPLMLFNLVERKFLLVGAVFGPHDFYLLALAVITGVVFIILFTVVFGRLFCGWVCPQTVLMEMVFRKIDYWLEGDHRQQKRLNASPWTREKAARKLTKYAVYFALSFLISNVLLAWVIGIDRLRTIVTDPPAEHLAGLAAMLVFTGVFYWIFAWFREQACILVCPYGRLQGVLLDRNSIVIAYDYVRGEPRGKLRRNTPRSEG